MRALLSAGLLAGVALTVGSDLPAAAQPPKDAPNEARKDTPAASLTRTKLLKTKVTFSFTSTPIGEILKEFAAQVDMQGDQPVMWVYAPGFPHAQKMTFAVKDRPLDEALHLLFTQVGELGYVVVSKDGDKYDGWVRVTTTGERGDPAAPPTAAQEAEAADKLALAKKLLAGGKVASAQPVLEIIVRKFPTTKAGIEALELLKKIEKDGK